MRGPDKTDSDGAPERDARREQLVLHDEEITVLLQAWSTGDAIAGERLFHLIYPELRSLARQQLARGWASYSLQATDLVHETFLRLVRQQRCAWQCRAQFFALVATLIRRILVDHVRRRQSQKRGRDVTPLKLEEVCIPVPELNLDLVALDDALVELAAVQVTMARIVDLRFFAGMSLDQTAAVLGLSRSSVQRKWRFAKAWLARKLEGLA